MYSLLKKTFFFALLILSTISFGQNISLSQNAQISIITCDTGNESYSLFGHTAIRIKDTANYLDMVYNYGAFDFATPNFVAKFAKGDLQYFAIAHSYFNFIQEYTYENRSVFEQELDITLEYKQKLFDNLNSVLASEDKYYTYKFIDKNCTSMVVDVVNQTLGSKVIFKKTETDQSYRSILFPYFDNSFYQKLGTSIIFGTKVDQAGTKIFLPLELHKNLGEIQFQNKALCKESKTILNFKKQTTSSWWDNIYTYLLFLIIILAINARSIHKVYLSILGILGLFFIYMGFYSFHLELANNYNVLLFNPALLVLVYFISTSNKKGIVNLCYLNIIFLLVYVIFIANKSHFWIVMPLVLSNATILIRLVLHNRK